MGTCDSSLENREKFINSHLSNQYGSEYLSSNSLPSLANKKIFPKEAIYYPLEKLIRILVQILQKM